MARPRKDPTKALTEHLPPVRVTLEDRQRIEAKALKAGLSVSDYIRRVAVTGKVAIKNELSASRMDTETLAELNRIGNNINQIAYHLNAGNAVASNFDDLQYQLYQTLEKVGRRFDT